MPPYIRRQYPLAFGLSHTEALVLIYIDNFIRGPTPGHTEAAVSYWIMV